MSEPVKHHVVSKVLIKQWAVDGNVAAWRLSTGRTHLRSPKSEGFVRHYVRASPQQTESRWNRAETDYPRVVTAIEAGTIFDNEQLQGVLFDIVAIHFARSLMLRQAFSIQSDHQRANGALRELSDTLAQWPELLDQAFTLATGLVPAGAEARMVGLEFVDQVLDDRFGPGQTFFVEQLLRFEDKFRRLLDGQGVQLGVADPAGEALFVLGDNPVQTYDSESGWVGVGSGVPVHRADAIVMPLTPKVVCAVGGPPGLVEVPPDAVERINQIQLAGAMDTIWIRPGVDPGGLVEAERARRTRRSAT